MQKFLGIVFDPQVHLVNLINKKYTIYIYIKLNFMCTELNAETEGGDNIKVW